MLGTYTTLGGSDVNWISSMFIAVIIIICLWTLAMGYMQVTRNEMSIFNLFMLFVRIGVVVSVAGGATLWMS